MKWFLVSFRVNGSSIPQERVIKAYTSSDAMGCVCGFVVSCKEISEDAAEVLVNFL